MGNLVKTEVQESIAKLRMNRPDKLNALSREMVEEMLAALKQLESDPSVKVIILSGEGKAFSAGGDIAAMKSLGGAHEVAEWIDFVSSLSKAIMDSDKYIVAAVHGYAAGAGFSLALAADFIVAEEEAKFALSFSNIGLIPDLGLIKALRKRISPPLAKEWISSAKVISAQQAERHGLINQISSGNVEEAATAFAEFLARGPGISNKYVKYLVNHLDELPQEAAFMQENLIQTMLLQTEDHKEGVTAFFEKRKPEFQGR
ncbi:enoyl-CoA hydratase/isomerase family protein [Planococcus sp. ISL-109]|uniref:enoyl-CoA hydratase/isomerase family protein n=1 Tax=Planococcus sp. ISL-109 TaxID=2819166 RepID=UPI001BE54856|nr:enoyl-CoA hydratase/isomerase family protein [Planococcus sp. ISL-109]MBT2582669.1 enoyl-CoA hydratase/isomerase family protein [Planococcus sp. ISL-109]